MKEVTRNYEQRMLDGKSFVIIDYPTFDDNSLDSLQLGIFVESVNDATQNGVNAGGMRAETLGVIKRV